MDVREIRKMTDQQILDAIDDQKDSLRLFRFQDASGQLEDANAMRRVRRDIARLKTVQRERQLAAEAVANKEGK